VKKKVEVEWDQLEVQGLEKVHRPLLVKLTFDKLSSIISITKWDVGFIPHSAFSWITKDDDLVEIIQMSKVGYAKPFRLAWDV
jgi:hypothetical protein